MMKVTSASNAPWHVWLVGGLLTVWSGFGAFDFWATIAKFEPYMSQFPQAARDYWYGLPAWIYVIWAIGVFSGLAGAITLLLRRRVAAPLLALSVVGALGSLVCSVINKPPAELSNPLMAAVIVVISASIAVYAHWLKSRGVLR